MDGVPIARARAAKGELLEKLASLPQLGGIGLIRIGDGFGVKVNLSEPLEGENSIPSEFEGVPVVIDVVGRVTAR